MTGDTTRKVGLSVCVTRRIRDNTCKCHMVWYIQTSMFNIPVSECNMNDVIFDYCTTFIMSNAHLYSRETVNEKELSLKRHQPTDILKTSDHYRKRVILGQWSFEFGNSKWDPIHSIRVSLYQHWGLVMPSQRWTVVYPVVYKINMCQI